VPNTDDIWNRLLHDAYDIKPEIRYLTRYQPSGSANTINKPVDIIVAEPHFNFVSQLGDQRGLKWLYALDMELNELIRGIASWIFDPDRMDLPNGIRSAYDSLIKRYPNIPGLINTDKLFQEIQQASNAFQRGQGNVFDTPPEMHSLYLMQIHLQNRIEYGSVWNILEKTQSIFEGHISAFSTRFNQEVLTFLCAKSASQSYKQEIHVAEEQWDRWYNNQVWNNVTPGLLASVLRCIQFTQNRTHRMKWSQKAINSIMRSPTEILMGYPSTYQTLLWDQFQLFRSDIALDVIKTPLEIYLMQLQEWLKRVLTHQNPFPSNRALYEEVKNEFDMTVAALYIFGSCRLSGSRYDKRIIEDAVQYMLSDPRPYECWWDHTNKPSRPSAGVSLTAMIVHALGLANPHSGQEFLRNALGWLISQQTLYGEWYQTNVAHPLEISVVVLDAQKLASTGDALTFSMLPEHTLQKDHPEKIPAEPISTHDEDEGVDTASGLDDIDCSIIRLYQEAEKTAEIKKKVYFPSYDQIAIAMYQNKMTSKIYSKQAISKRVNKLRKSGLLLTDDDKTDGALRYNPQDMDDLDIKSKF
jgi:hypothetical protein